MRITDLDDSLALQLEAAWTASMPSQVDAQRPLDYLAWVLHSSDSQWYQIEGHRAWLYIMNIVPGHTADLHALNLDGWSAVDPPVVLEELRNIMEEWNLQRLTVNIPAPVGKLHRALKLLGFTKEGRMRKAIIFNGRPTDAVIYGLLRHEVEPREAKAAPRRRRRRRKGNKQWEPKTQPEPRSEASRKSAESSDNSGTTPKTSTPPPSSKATNSSDLLNSLEDLTPYKELPKVVLTN